MKKNNHSSFAVEWLEKGGHDLKAAEILLSEKGPTDTICFLAHQASEKHLKGFLVHMKASYQKIHDLIRLNNQCKKFDVSFSQLDEEVLLLNPYYIESRYPFSSPANYPLREAKQAVEAAQAIVRFVCARAAA